MSSSPRAVRADNDLSGIESNLSGIESKKSDILPAYIELDKVTIIKDMIAFIVIVFGNVKPLASSRELGVLIHKVNASGLMRMLNWVIARSRTS